MFKIGYILVISVLMSVTTLAQSGLRISGKVRLLQPTEIALKTIEGEALVSASVKSGEEFAMGPLEIEPDVYLICFGETSQPIYLTNTEVTIKGFYDCKHVGNLLAICHIESGRRQLIVVEVVAEGAIFTG